MSRKRRRNSLRHQGWHYGAAGYYFVTFCTAGQECLFDSAEFRQIAEQTLQKLPAFKTPIIVRLDTWIVMPNHVHAIIVIIDGAPSDAPRPQKAVPGTLGALIGKYKAAVTRQINTARKSSGSRVWQRGYHDRVIRNERELNAIREYIRRNPERWAEDRDNYDRLTAKMTHHP